MARRSRTSGPSGAPPQTAPIAIAMKRTFLLLLAALSRRRARAGAEPGRQRQRLHDRRRRAAGPLRGDADRRRRQGEGALPARRAAAGADRARIDGRGRTLIPGLIDAHGHVMGLGMSALRSISATPIRSRRRRPGSALMPPPIPTPRWIVGRGWNQERWRLGRFPTAADLDAAVADRPVWLERVDGHAGWANSAAMREAGSPPRPGRPRAAGSSEAPRHLRRRRHAAGRARHSRRRCPPSASARLPRRRSSCSPTASPPSPTWARAARIGR